MHRSIMQELTVNKCFLCGRQGPVEVHHCIHGTAGKRKAEADGLLVNLCPECHRKLHDTGRGDKELMSVAEARWINYNMASVEEFIGRYGKNYIV